MEFPDRSHGWDGSRRVRWTDDFVADPGSAASFGGLSLVDGRALSS